MNSTIEDRPKKRKLRRKFPIFSAVAASIVILGQSFFVLGDETVAASNSAGSATSAGQVPPSPAPGDSTESSDAKSAPPNDLSLDALLDLADKDPQSLQSIKVSPSSMDRMTTPDQVFRPEAAGGTAANSTGELLSQSLGVVTRSTSALNQDARVRGYSGSQIVGTTNGVNQGKSRIDVDSLFSQIDPSLVESILVIPGPYAVEYGPGYAFFNAQLITPKRSAAFASDSESRFGFNTNGQQFTWRETAGVSDRTSGAVVSIGQRMGMGYSPGANSNDFTVPAKYHEQDVYTAINFDVTERSRIDASYLHQQIYDTQLPGVTYDISNQNADQFSARWTWRDDFTGRDRLQLQGWWNQVKYYGNASDPTKQETFFSQLVSVAFPPATNGTIVANGRSNNGGFRANILWGDDEVWQAKSGVDWRRVSQYHQELILDSTGADLLGNGILGIPESSSNDFGIFTNVGATFTDRIKMSFGQRIDAVGYYVNQSDPVAQTTVATPTGQSVSGFSAPTRVLDMTYLTGNFQVTDDTVLNSGVAFAMRPPNLSELYSNSPSAPLVRFGNSTVYGDSNLAAEKNLQFDLGLTKRLEKSTWGARMFYSEIFDYIGLGATNNGNFPVTGTSPDGTLGRGQPFSANPFVPNPNLSSDVAQLGYIYRNIDLVTMEGFEMHGEQRVQPWLEFLETLNYTRATNHDPTWTDFITGQVNHLNTKEGLPGIYPLNAATTVRLVEPTHRKWTAEWQTRYARQQDYLARSLGEVGTPGFVVHNINTTYRVSDHISFRASLLNVLNLNYYEHTSLAIIDKSGNVTFVKNPGISLFLGAECTF